MRKSITMVVPADLEASTDAWLDMEVMASVEVSSETAGDPIENALIPGRRGWRASLPGEQRICLLFDDAQTIRRVQICFTETELERRNEFVLSWTTAPGLPLREIVRQQYSFSPHGSTCEWEDYQLDLRGVRVLELRIRPDGDSTGTHASLTSLRIA